MIERGDAAGEYWEVYAARTDAGDGPHGHLFAKFLKRVGLLDGAHRRMSKWALQWLPLLPIEALLYLLT